MVSRDGLSNEPHGKTHSRFVGGAGLAALHACARIAANLSLVAILVSRFANRGRWNGR